ncbi:MIP/aquaporin family protein [Trujillonella endophytica]|uniref:MIP/aquaporin family protein n=1 Tax=Trujillonella endophytica TaxID=673521 RepID=UPI001B8D8EE0|nr:aquaporin [Trujillella endophytica]
MRSLIAEFLGTALLVFLAVGSAVAGFDALGPVGVAFAFGFVLLALAYAIGPVSGCHINPAVTLGVLLSGGMVAKEAAGYWVAQFAGGIAGAAVLKLLTSGFGDVEDQTGALGSNDWGATISGGGAFVLEVLLTFMLVFVVLLVTGKAAAPGFAGLAIGLVLTAVHLIGIPLDGTSVNPARSLGPALFAGGEPLEHVWLFILAPLIGGALAVAVARVLRPPTLDETREARGGEAAVDRTGAELPAEVRAAEEGGSRRSSPRDR